MHFICRSFIGSPSESNWSQYWENEPDDPFIIAQKGHLFGLVNIDSLEPVEDISSIGHNLIAEVNQYYFYKSKETDILSSLKNTLAFTSGNPLFLDVNLSLFLVVVFKNQVYFGIYGQGEIILNRSRKISRILSGEKNKTFVLSGPLLSKDRILLITDNFYNELLWNKIKSILIDENIQIVEENFISSLYSSKDQTGLAAALIGVEEEQEEEILTELVTKVPEGISRPEKSKKNPLSFFKKIFKKKPIYIDHRETVQISRRRKTNLFVGIFLLIGLGISLFLGYQKNTISKNESQYQQFRQDLDKKLSDALAVRNLNFDSALELAKQAQSIYSKMIALKIHSDEWVQYDEKIKSLLSQTGESSDDSFLKSFYDTSLITDNPRFSKIILKNNFLYLFNNSVGRIDMIDINQKNTKNISSDSKIKSALGFVENNGSIYLVDDKSVSLVDKNGVSEKINFFNLNKNIVQKDIKSWNSAFYLLDSSNSIIWKFNSNASGFGAGEIWLKDNQKLTEPSSLAINGNIWVLSKIGEISSFVRGAKDSFKQSQIIKTSDAKNLVVGVDNGILAFTDGDNLIYVYKKTGELSAKYNLKDKKILSIGIDEKSNSLLILCSDQKIYKINL